MKRMSKGKCGENDESRSRQFLNETVKIIYISMVQKESRLIHAYVSFIPGTETEALSAP